MYLHSPLLRCNKMYEEFKQQFKWKWPPILQINYEFSGSKLWNFLSKKRDKNTNLSHLQFSLVAANLDFIHFKILHRKFMWQKLAGGGGGWGGYFFIFFFFFYFFYFFYFYYYLWRGGGGGGGWMLLRTYTFHSYFF